MEAAAPPLIPGALRAGGQVAGAIPARDKALLLTGRKQKERVFE